MIAVTSNLDEVIKSLEAVIKDIDARLSSMVQNFTYNITLSAIKFTPMGDARSSEKVAEMYDARFKNTGLLPREGFAQGSWGVDTFLNTATMTNTEGFYGKGSGSDAAEKVFFDDLSKYRLGNDLYITNTGPYIARLQDNYSDYTQGLGIMEPTEEDIRNIYSQNLAKYYNVE
jgi:hypothetical protein